MDFVILKPAITNYTTVIKFVDSGRLTEILSVISPALKGSSNK